MRILPAILTPDPADLELKIRQAEAFTEWVQIDIMDGEFVPSRSIDASHLAAVKTTLNMEVHLMVKDPETYLEGFQKAGARRVVFHQEATPFPGRVLQEARALGLQVGLAVNPETSISSIEPFLGEVDFVLLLSVYPGFYGREFIPEVLDKIGELRARAPGLEIGIDGGIKADNIGLAKASGADYACVGSAIFNQADPRQSFLHFQALIGYG